MPESYLHQVRCIYLNMKIKVKAFHLILLRKLEPNSENVGQQRLSAGFEISPAVMAELCY